jgi:hypothetical protein
MFFIFFVFEFYESYSEFIDLFFEFLYWVSRICILNPRFLWESCGILGVPVYSVGFWGLDLWVCRIPPPPRVPFWGPTQCVPNWGVQNRGFQCVPNWGVRFGARFGVPFWGSRLGGPVLGGFQCVPNELFIKVLFRGGSGWGVRGLGSRVPYWGSRFGGPVLGVPFWGSVLASRILGSVLGGPVLGPESWVL